MIVEIDLPHIKASFDKGQMIGIVGPDGSGKTTLMRMLASLLVPKSGKITIDGLDSVLSREEIRSIIGYMPQRFGLYEDLTVMQNLCLYADLRGAERHFDRLLHFTNLGPFVDRLAGNLSGGMKQKLGLACALMKKPKVLLLDEPSVGVDPISRRELWKMTHELLEEGITVIWSTTYLDEAERCHEVLLLDEGKLLYKGTPDGLKENVKGRVCKVDGGRELLLKLIKEENTVDAVIEADQIRLVVKKPFEGMHQVAPRFEDAFMDMLGGGPKEESLLAKRTPQIEGESEGVIQVRNLTKKFGNFTAVNNISFSVKKGEVFGLLGPNGAGKSTTFKMLCGLIKPTSGQTSVAGKDIRNARGEIGYMAQKFSLYSDLTVYQNLKFFAGVYQANSIDQMIEIFDLQPFLKVRADDLPLGFKQRLALACSNMHHPKILFLDEATSGVDARTRREFWNHINSLVQRGVTILITTHFMDEAEYCDRIALVYKGQLIAMDSPQVIKNQANKRTLEEAFISLVEGFDAT